MQRRWILALLGGIVAVWMALFLFPVRERDADLELIALGGDGRFAESITIPSHWASTTGLGPDAAVRVPLILAVRNNGRRASPPARLELSLPTRYRITRGDGTSLPVEIVPGTPLVRYFINVPTIAAASGTVAGYLPVLDTLWLEPIIPPYYCIALSDSVPDFVPAPPAPVEAIARVRIFYSFAAVDLKERQTGLLAVQLDPALLEQEAQKAPPVFPTEYIRSGNSLPPLPALVYAGSRRSRCGDPQDPMELLTTLWETPEGGRLFVLDYGGAPRKYLFDLDRDSIIELELWDATGAGRFDARRQARLPIPAFLMPPRVGPPPFDPADLAGKTPEQLLALDRYASALTEPYRFRTQPPPSEPQTRRYRPGTIGGDVDDGDEPLSGYTIRYWSDPALDRAPAATGDPQPPPIRNRAPAHPSTETPPPSIPRTTPAAPPARDPPTLGRPLIPATPTPPAARPQPPGRPRTEPQTRPGTEPPPSERPAPSQTAPDRPAPAEPDTAKPKPRVLGTPIDSIPRP